MKRTAVLIICLALAIMLFGIGYSLQFASTTWQEFVNAGEVIAEARIVSADYNTSIFNFQVLETYKGTRVKNISIVRNLMYDGSLGRIGDTCFIAVKKEKDNWTFATPGRSYWPIVYEQTPELKSVVRVGIDDFLIRDFPKSIKKKYRIQTWLVNGKAHIYDVNIYLLDDVRKFLKSELKQ